MKASIIPFRKKLTLTLFSVLAIAFNPVMAKSDKQIMEEVQKARALSQQHENHTSHSAQADESQKYRGVFLGYLPCPDCAGVKVSLSLKNRNNYLLVTQYAKASSREFFEKGKYTWDEKSSIVTLTSRKDSSIKKYRIEDDETLVQLSPDGQPLGYDVDKYTLRRSDTVKSTEVHIH